MKSGSFIEILLVNDTDYRLAKAKGKLHSKITFGLFIVIRRRQWWSFDQNPLPLIKRGLHLKIESFIEMLLVKVDEYGLSKTRFFKP